MSRKSFNGNEGKKAASDIVVEGKLPFPRILLSAGIELDALVEIDRQLRMEALKR